MREMSNRLKIVIGVPVAIVIMCAIIIPVVLVANGQRENIGATEPATIATTQGLTSPTPTTLIVSNSPTRPSVQALQRFDCFPDTDKQSKGVCQARGCSWIPINVARAPSCFYPPQYRSYTATEQAVPYGKKYILERNPVLPTHYGSPSNTIKLDIQFQASNRLRIKTKMLICIHLLAHLSFNEKDERNRREYQKRVPFHI
ncbi:uncharacterized protein TRIADDRAFT_56703 [Trichoplax adhaerens]|uniref:P-type domain-containing protein n=1 Tax=Trichoplax adhaerens TaxID=10228 RepID=B3RWC6_TRIAD|nr:hypothetical protein TRIADDRAFT_56703 [Trichoplax adhaerens]EDV25111.1 hypothetical protein TRIADDRAFT_56703 [Trichoplax adhaerens]|eukprot:XP_002113001.1 hypothetical protein TRIADDRAFT_56703 [Trichoplax adhaerens]